MALVTEMTPIRAQHFTELRDGIQGLWTAHGMGTIPAWTAGVPTAGTPILAGQINDLRGWLDQADPPLLIWTGFHWCSPVEVAQNTEAQRLFEISGRWGSVVILNPATEADFLDACNRVMA